MDAFLAAKLASFAGAYGGTSTVSLDASSILGEWDKGIEYMTNQRVNRDRVVAYMTPGTYKLLKQATGMTRFIEVTNGIQNVDRNVAKLDGVRVIEVPADMMKTAYTFQSNAAGGFVPANNARNIYMLVCPKKGAHLVKKTENMRIFTPEQNLDADAYKFDYRIYYDVFVAKSGLDAIWSWVSPAVSITSQPANKSVTEGSISGNISVTASSSGTLSYQWYSCGDDSGNDAVKVAGGTSASLTIPTDLTEGKHYFYCLITVNGVSGIKSNIACVTVA